MSEPPLFTPYSERKLSMTDIAIIGGGPAGLTAAIYASRAGKSVTVYEKESFGGQIVFSPLVENYPGIAHISGEDYAALLTAQAEALGVKLENGEVTALRKASDTFAITVDGSVVDARAVILATGVAHKGLGLPGEADLIGCGLSFCAVCDGPFCAGQDAAVIGGGDTALQDAIFLSGICRSVTLIHRRDSFRAEKRLVEKASSQGNIHFLYDTVTEEYLTEDGSVSGLRLRNVKTGESFTKPFDGIFLAVGQKPQNDFLHGAAAVDPEGYLYSDETALTGTAGIFAAGDCRTKDVRQLTTAVGDGACAAIAACRYLDRCIIIINRKKGKLLLFMTEASLLNMEIQRSGTLSFRLCCRFCLCLSLVIHNSQLKAAANRSKRMITITEC